MADFVAVLKKTLDGMGETTPEMRARVYDKARSTIAAKLAAINPPPPAGVVERQKRALEDAIATRRDGLCAKPARRIDDPLAELENIFSSIDRNKNQPSHASAGSRRPSRAWQPRAACTRRKRLPQPAPGQSPARRCRTSAPQPTAGTCEAGRAGSRVRRRRSRPTPATTMRKPHTAGERPTGRATAQAQPWRR